MKLSTFDDTDPVLSRGLNLMNDHLIGRNNGLYNALTKFFQHDNQQHQGIELYKLINEYYTVVFKTLVLKSGTVFWSKNVILGQKASFEAFFK